MSPMSPALAGRFFTTSATWEAPGSSWMYTKYHIHTQTKKKKGKEIQLDEMEISNNKFSKL